MWWPFSVDHPDNEPEPEPESEPEPKTEVVQVEEELSKEIELPVVRLRWGTGESAMREEIVEGYAIEHRESGLAFQEVNSRVESWTGWLDSTHHVCFGFRDVRFVPYKHLLEWEIVEREEHEFAEVVAYTEEREVSDE